MRITVLSGGPSDERAISLRSGEAVTKALRTAGHDVFVSDISPTDLAGLDHPADVIFPVLHGEFGESGELQDILEARGLPFVGSGSAASRLGMDKAATKDAWRSAALPTADWELLTTTDFAAGQFGFPVVLKANASGSSIDVFVCRTVNEAKEAAAALLAKHGQCLMERFVTGTELTVAILEGRALPPIRIETKHAFLDYTAKYTAGGSTHEFDLRLPPGTVAECERLAVRAHDVVGCRDLSRVDIKIAADGRPMLLEINTMPGFTDVSLLPDAAKQAGIGFPELVDRLVRAAAARRSTGANTPV